MVKVIDLDDPVQLYLHLLSRADEEWNKLTEPRTQRLYRQLP